MMTGIMLTTSRLPGGWQVSEMKRPTPGDWIEEDGYSRQVLAPSAILEDDTTAMEVLEVPADSEIDPRRHDRTEELFFILQEGGTLVVNEAAFTPEKGEVIVCEPGDTHAVINDSDQAFRILVVKLNREEDDTIMEED